MERAEVQQMIDQSLKNSFSKRVGDTPTDMLQLVNKKYLKNQIFCGAVNQAGTSVFLPTGWTSTRVSTGIYRVTHNLNTTQYSVVAISNAYICLLEDGAQLPNRFGIVLKDGSGVVFDNNWWFIMVLK